MTRTKLRTIWSPTFSALSWIAMIGMFPDMRLITFKNLLVMSSATSTAQ